MKAKNPFPERHGIRPRVWLCISVVGLAVVIAIRPFKESPQDQPTKDSPAGVNRLQPISLAKRNVGKRRLSKEPVHQGRTAREWVEDLKSTKTRQAAHQAFIAMGPSAIPVLREAMNDLRSLNGAVFALAGIGKEALPVLLDLLMNGSLTTGREIAGTGALQAQALLAYEDQIVPMLVQCMQSEDATIRRGAVNALQSYCKRPDLVMPTLLNCLTDEDSLVRGSAVTVIQKFGRSAEGAVPVLIRLAREDGDEQVKTRAAESLRVIAPDWARREGF